MYISDICKNCTGLFDLLPTSMSPTLIVSGLILKVFLVLFFMCNAT